MKHMDMIKAFLYRHFNPEPKSQLGTIFNQFFL